MAFTDWTLTAKFMLGRKLKICSMYESKLTENFTGSAILQDLLNTAHITH